MLVTARRACRPNAYHNSTHAADVTQALLAILYTDGLHARLTDLELLACLLSAILHDVAHPGLSNPFLTKTQDEQALMYNDQSANEHLSLSVGFKILQARECNLFTAMSRDDYFYLRRCVLPALDRADASCRLRGAIFACDGAACAEETLCTLRALSKRTVVASWPHCAAITSRLRQAALHVACSRCAAPEWLTQTECMRVLT